MHTACSYIAVYDDRCWAGDATFLSYYSVCVTYQYDEHMGFAVINSTKRFAQNIFFLHSYS